MSGKYIILILFIVVSVIACKRKPKKSLEELPTKVETFQENTFLKSQIDSHALAMIQRFGSEFDSAVYTLELDTISDIIQKEKEAEIFHTPTGIAYIIKKYGSGEYPQKGDIIQVQVETNTLNGSSIFSTSALKQPLLFVLGVGQVVPSWDEIFPNVQEGTQFQIIAPSAMSYGKKGYHKAVSPNTILKYDIIFEKIVITKNSVSKQSPSLKVKGKDVHEKEDKYKIPTTLKKPEKL